MAWNSYGLDREAQRLVLNARKRDEETRAKYPKASRSLNEGYKMRTTAAYGLERFWGEHIRYANKAQQTSKEESQEENANNSAYWKATWDTLVDVMAKASVIIPNDPIVKILGKSIQIKDTDAIKNMSAKLWGEVSLINKEEAKLTLADQQVALAVLIQLCDCIIWWTQRYKGGAIDDEDS